MSIFQALVLGIVQGLTEFIPVSSSAHLIIIPWLAGWNDPGIIFDVALHLGTLVALIWYFRAEWVRYIRAGVGSIMERKIGDDLDRRLAWFLVIGTIPGVLAGLFLESTINDLFHTQDSLKTLGPLVAMGVIVALFGLVMFIAERVTAHRRELGQMSLKDSVIIGVSQALALFPGVSRSGSTITAGLYLGLTRETAARFSFLLSTPIILGAGAKSLFDAIQQASVGAMVRSDLLAFIVGFIAAAISGYLVIKFLLRFLQVHSTDIFVYYRFLLAALIIIVAVLRT